MVRTPNFDLYIPDGVSERDACARATHLAIGAHQDDLEFMAFSAIAECFAAKRRGFFGVVLTDGVGSIRSGAWAEKSDQEFAEIRRCEQRSAADIGDYGGMLQLGLPSKDLKLDPEIAAAQLLPYLRQMRPREVFIHNPFDKHPTHIAAFQAALRALRLLPEAQRPKRVLGCEVWRGLDWLPDNLKVVLDSSQAPELASKLHAVFVSQIGPGKRYDLATVGRWQANATFYQPRHADRAERVAYGVDLSSLVADPSIDVATFAEAHLADFAAEVLSMLRS